MMAVTELKFWAAKINFLQQSVRSYEKASDVFAWMRGEFSKNFSFTGMITHVKIGNDGGTAR